MNLEELKKLAEKANDGDLWFRYGENPEDSFDDDDMRFIEACSPKTILALIRELEEARNDEREGIACFLVALGHHDLAGQVFSAMTRPINEERRNTSFDTWLKRQQKG